MNETRCELCQKVLESEINYKGALQYCNECFMLVEEFYFDFDLIEENEDD